MEKTITLPEKLDFKGTGGEWTVKKNSQFYEINTDAENRNFGFNLLVFDPTTDSSDLSLSEENEANAHVIAAAPKLLEALQLLLLNGHTEKSKTRANQAINKALNQ